MVLAVKQISRMRGGAQSHLMRCSDDRYYVVKFQNNPQGLRILANELLGTRLAARMGLRVPDADIVDAREELIANTEDMVMQLGAGARAARPASNSARVIRASPPKPQGTIFFRMSSCGNCRTCRISSACWFLTNGHATPMGARRYFFASENRFNIRRR
jgi:HipA-like protein